VRQGPHSSQLTVCQNGGGLRSSVPIFHLPRHGLKNGLFTTDLVPDLAGFVNPAGCFSFSTVVHGTVADCRAGASSPGGADPLSSDGGELADFHFALVSVEREATASDGALSGVIVGKNRS